MEGDGIIKKTDDTVTLQIKRMFLANITVFHFILLVLPVTNCSNSKKDFSSFEKTQTLPPKYYGRRQVEWTGAHSY